MKTALEADCPKPGEGRLFSIEMKMMQEISLFVSHDYYDYSKCIFIFLRV